LLALRLKLQGRPAWVIVNALPAMRTLAERAVVAELGWTVRLAVLEPVPEEGEVRVIQLGPGSTDQEQADADAFQETEEGPPLAERESLTLLRLMEQPWPA
jgi:hypothetical protein